MATLDGQTSSRAAKPPSLQSFDPSRFKGRLSEAEHFGRYWWASQLVGGKDVLDASRRAGIGREILLAAGAARVSALGTGEEVPLRDAESVVKADLSELPFEDDSFDVIVCWDSIEYSLDGERVVAEFGRVLRSEGILFISSPNPGVNSEDEERAVQGYTAEGLANLARHHFSDVAAYRQHTWFASVIDAIDGAIDSPGGQDTEASSNVRTIDELADGAQSYSMILCGNTELPPMSDLVTLGDTLEIRRLEEQLRSTERTLLTAEAEKERARGQVREISAALLGANQRLAQVPVLEHRLEEVHAETRALVQGMESSLSWRLTAPLRRLRALFRRT